MGRLMCSLAARVALVLALSFAAGGAARAAKHTQPWRCQIEEGKTNTEWGECMGREVASQEVRLNRAWRKLLPLLQPRSRADLTVEQRAWVAYKEKSCAMWANGDFGRQGQVLDWGACRSAVVGRRADELEDIIEEVENLSSD